MEGDEVCGGSDWATESQRRGFAPDPLLGAFASGLACNCLSPMMVKQILEAEGYFEPQKLRISEWLDLMIPFFEEVLACSGANVGSQKALAGSDKRGLRGRSQPSYADLNALWQHLQDLFRSPTFVRVRAKMTLEGRFGIIGAKDLRTARQLACLQAHEDLTKSHYPDLSPSLDYARECLIQSMRRPAHRPSLGKTGERFRTGAVAAARFFRVANGDPPISWKWVADRLNSADVPRPRGVSFKAKTIENWSSKGEYNEPLLRGMKKLAGAKLFARLTPAQISELAITTAIAFSGCSRKLPN